MSLKSVIKKALNLIPLTDTVVFESVPDLSDNTNAVFEEMLRRGINKKYKLIWLLNKTPDKPYEKIPNVKYIPASSKKAWFYRLTAKCLICCNNWLCTLRKGQTSFYLSHGTTIKRLQGYYFMPETIDYCLSAGESVAFLCENEFGAKKEKIFSLGFPRNDALTAPKHDLNPYFGDYEKFIVWYPTYRQHKNTGAVSSGNPLPIIHDSKSAEILNQSAKECNTLIILKPHFAQDISYIKKMNLSNIRFIDDSFFESNGISSYEFVGSCDALITDYSSIYYDYTLCDKPIALVWEDYEDYKRDVGFAEGAEELLSGGEKVYCLNELTDFVKNVYDGTDLLRDARREICEKVNYSTDGRNSERVADFIIRKSGLF